MRFVDYADVSCIVLAVLPPHLTYCLQPLNVGLFYLLLYIIHSKLTGFYRELGTYTSYKTRFLASIL